MMYDVKYRIDSDVNLKKFLRENSQWYKLLNRNVDNFQYFVSDMRVKYKLTVPDRINKAVDQINVLQSFFDALK